MIICSFSTLSIGLSCPHSAIQVHVAAFAVSSYYLTFARPARKPFNPLLGETYELTREDKGFRYVGEQVREMYDIIFYDIL